MIRVLYAEDDPQVAGMVRLAFNQYPNCALDVVTTGQACLATIQQAPYDVLLLDLMLPDLNGLQVLGQLIARRDSTPVVMVSGQGQNDLAVRAMRAGAVDCIDKNSPEFFRIPEIVLRVQARYPRRPELGEVAGPPVHRVLVVDGQPAWKENLAVFLASSVPRLQLGAETTESIKTLIREGAPVDGVIIGPNVSSDEALAMLRQLRAYDESIPSIIVSEANNAEVTIAAFKLGAHDFLLTGPGSESELVFSLNQALKQRDIEQRNTQLQNQLASLNRSLAEQVAARTADLEKEIQVRREAERRSDENASRLQALSTRLLRVQEDERHSLAHELHDQIGQLLTGLRFQLESARQAGPNAGVENALTITDELLRSVRSIALQLRPRLLDDLGLRPALEWHANVFRNQTGITVDLEVSLPERPLGPELQIVVFRMVQEALTNVARHSGASAASVTVAADDTSLQVEVSDRGCGFDFAEALARHNSLGLAGMAERVRLAGGRLEVYSQRGRGTRLHAEFALTPFSSPP